MRHCLIGRKRTTACVMIGRPLPFLCLLRLGCFHEATSLSALSGLPCSLLAHAGHQPAANNTGDLFASETVYDSRASCSEPWTFYTPQDLEAADSCQILMPAWVDSCRLDHAYSAPRVRHVVY